MICDVKTDDRIRFYESRSKKLITKVYSSSMKLQASNKNALMDDSYFWKSDATKEHL